MWYTGAEAEAHFQCSGSTEGIGFNEIVSEKSKSKYLDG